MKWYLLFATLVAGLILLSVNGCYGPAPGSKIPLALTTVPASPDVQSGGLVVLSSTVPTGGSQVVSTKWLASPNVGTFLNTADIGIVGETASNTWTAPVVTQQTKVTLTLQLKTLDGTISLASIIMYVVPVVPAFNFASTLPSSVAVTLSNTNPPVPVPATVTMAGSVTTAPGDPIIKYAWTLTSVPAGETGSFDNPANEFPTWTSPSLGGGTTPVTVTWSVTMTTQSGIIGNSTFNVTVTPP